MIQTHLAREAKKIDATLLLEKAAAIDGAAGASRPFTRVSAGPP